MSKRDLEILEAIIASRGAFGHREHLELAWTYLKRYEGDELHRAVASAIRHVAAKHGAPGKYHETITRFWVHVVALHRAASGAASFDQFMAENPALLDSRLLGRHYSRELIGSSGARNRWAPPDLCELPSLA